MERSNAAYETQLIEHPCWPGLGWDGGPDAFSRIGNDLFYPVRIALTGTHSRSEFDNLLPLFEDASAVSLGIPSVEERVDRFVSA